MAVQPRAARLAMLPVAGRDTVPPRAGHPAVAPTGSHPLAGWLEPRRGDATRRAPGSDDLFERAAPLYAFLREHLFRDDTDRVTRTLWPGGAPPDGALVLEVGCGPGLYARRLATRYPGLRAVGVDRSPALLARARERAASAGLANCRFVQGDALALDWPDRTVDAVVAARLLTVVDGPAVLAELHRVLRPGGRCFLAEPVSVLGTALPFALLRLAGWIAGSRRLADPRGRPAAGPDARLPSAPRRRSAAELGAIVGAPPWASLELAQANGYLYASCRKGFAGAPAPGGQPRRPARPTRVGRAAPPGQAPSSEQMASPGEVASPEQATTARQTASPGQAAASPEHVASPGQAAASPEHVASPGQAAASPEHVASTEQAVPAWLVVPVGRHA